MIAADVDLNVHFHGRPSVMNSGGWESRLGLGESFPDDWRGAEGVDWDVLRAYGREVRTCVADLFASVNGRDLERSFEMRALVTKRPGTMPEVVSLGTWKRIDLYTLYGGCNIWMHGGESACLNGLQGAGGYGKFRYLAP